MKKIISLRVENLRLSAEMAYYYFVINAVSIYSNVASTFARAFGQFKAAYDYQNELYMRHDRKVLSERVAKAEEQRDKWLRKLRNNVREVVEFGSGEKLEAARILSTIIEEYGGAKIPDMRIEEQTGVLLNLYEDLQEKYPEEVDLLGLTDVVASAKQANLDFIEAQNARTQSDADYGKKAMEEARPETLRKYRYFIDSVNVESEVDDDGELVPFINFMNAKIDEMRPLAKQKTSSSSQSSGSGSDGEETIPKRFVTFTYIDEKSQRIPVVVGAPLEALPNTVGYKWKPEVPEVMPNRNIIFREVPIEDREATATFHFFDHTEEEIRQFVGTALTAPENTAGYYWDPEVPETMPEEDTQYYELPEEEEEQQPTLYTVRFMKGSELVAEQQYEAGAVIQAPAAPSGYEWEDYPYRMPAEDITVNAVRRNIPGGGGGSGFE